MHDLISRKEAIDALKKIMFTHLFECGEYGEEDTREFSIMNAEKALDVIETLLSTEPERKKGKWNFIGDNMFECTHCGVIYTTQQLNGLRNYDIDPYVPRFCPNCGAGME